MTSSATLSAELLEAVMGRTLTVVYQPLFDLRGEGMPRHPVAVEALCRWVHPRLGLIVPDRFIPLAETEGLMEDLGAAVLDEACARVSAWQHAGFPLGLSVNASPSQFSPAFAASLSERIARVGLEPGSLTIEITEAPAPQLLPSVVDLLPILRAANVKISIDDLGAGDLTLEVLEEVRVDEVKIDRSLIRRDDPEADAMIAAVLERAEHFGWAIVAEGIETVADLERSRRRGCPVGQGYLLGKPMPADELGRVLEAARRESR